MKISYFNPNESAPSIHIIIELCYFSLDQWEIRIHLLWGKSFNIPFHCDPHLNQTKFNDLLPLTIPGVLVQFCVLVIPCQDSMLWSTPFKNIASHSINPTWIFLFPKGNSLRIAPISETCVWPRFCNSVFNSIFDVSFFVDFVPQILLLLCLFHFPFVHL